MPERWNVTDKIEDPRANWKHLYQYPNYCLVGGTLASGVVFEPNAVLAEVGGELVLYDGAAADGSETPVGVLYGKTAIDTAGGTEPGRYVKRGPSAIVKAGLVFQDGQTQAHRDAAIAALEALGVMIEDGV